ncbi:MAG: type 2 isopentenyl-diphosphate Delta-isomerase [Anaerococcus hydrogenalis]|uniref:type 2 isopentenyl-diphosphate Delta-isomerase n=1 Tax=Anaerococcus hydrogenalis TaxID=33029 RepID=UPI00290AFC2A|nr:type 2 isopentenyl-diphosphate Delta-isomerase [Anaerococcus hydrogenalis]MDU3687751.1 type 2 isopentenyl-diphosphate Delta-isomerase [Anaerococcus hydrogenalis]
MDEKRRARKDEHIENYLRSEFRSKTLLNNVYVEHNALSDINFDEIDTSIEFMGKKISMPVMVNAMTGGTEISEDINEDLSNICKDLNIPMAVGSESIALKDIKARESFSLLKEKDQVFKIGNLGLENSIENFEFAKDLIGARAMQAHLNVAQELVMAEGERDFSNNFENLKNIKNNLSAPLIVKEVGFGMNKEVGKKLLDIGIKYIDVAGKGGTNFIEIEDMRIFDKDYSEFYSWGIPTAKSILDLRSLSDDFFLISSGGIRNASDVCKSIIIGADMCAISGEVLSFLLRGDYDYAQKYLEELQTKIKIFMALVGVKNIEELKKVPYKITGRLKELIS